MATTEKIEQLRKALADNPGTGPVVIVEDNGRHFLSDGWDIGREITPEEEERIRRLIVYIDIEDLKA